jgi:hypothetical protein
MYIEKIYENVCDPGWGRTLRYSIRFYKHVTSLRSH